MATTHQFILWAPFKAGPDFAARWAACIDAHMAGAARLVEDGIMSASSSVSTHSR